jgi:hypothetical protein
MRAPDDLTAHSFGWLRDLGLGEPDLRDLNPCVPGEFTLPDAYYVNTATPGQTYRGTEEGTLPVVSGRWYLIPRDVAERFPALTREAASVARAVRLSQQRVTQPPPGA